MKKEKTSRQSSKKSGKIKDELPELAETLPPLLANEAYSGLDRLSVLVASLGTLRTLFMNTAGINGMLDAADCEALAAFVTLLEEDFDNVIEMLYKESEGE